MRVLVSAGACMLGFKYVTFSEARRWGFSPGTPVSSSLSLVKGSANKIKRNRAV